MKFAICNETFQDWPFDKACAYARELGYTGIEIAPFTLAESATDISTSQREQVSRQAADAGLAIIGLHWLLAKTTGCHLTSPDAEVRRNTSQYLGELARLCRDVGGDVLVLGSPQQRNLLTGVSHDEATNNAIDVITAALPALEENHVTLALEPLGPAEGDFWVTTSETIGTIERIHSPRVQLHLDVKAMSSESLPIPEVIRQGTKYMVHFHANDSNKRGPGMGDVDFVPILQTLRDVGYEGWVSVEVFDYEPGIEALATESIRYLEQCLEQLE